MSWSTRDLIKKSDNKHYIELSYDVVEDSKYIFDKNENFVRRYCGYGDLAELEEEFTDAPTSTVNNFEDAVSRMKRLKEKALNL